MVLELPFHSKGVTMGRQPDLRKAHPVKAEVVKPQQTIQASYTTAQPKEEEMLGAGH